MTQARAVTATFQLRQTLTVTVTGSGSVTSMPAGINCGADCTEVYAYGTQVTLTPTPAAGYTFTSWSGACTGSGACVVTMTAAARLVTATFTNLPYTLSVSLDGSGTVTSVPAGINCGTDCLEVYNSGTQVTLTASPATGYAFTGWSGACTGDRDVRRHDERPAFGGGDVHAPPLHAHREHHRQRFGDEQPGRHQLRGRLQRGLQLRHASHADGGAGSRLAVRRMERRRVHRRRCVHDDRGSHGNRDVHAGRPDDYDGLARGAGRPLAERRCGSPAPT